MRLLQNIDRDISEAVKERNRAIQKLTILGEERAKAVEALRLPDMSYSMV